MPTENWGPVEAPALGAKASPRCRTGRPPRVPFLLAVVVFLAVTPNVFAYVVKLKDGTLVFARTQYVVKGTNAIITLENGTLTQIPLVQVDEPGSEKYNRENYGNAIRINTPPEHGIRLSARVGATSSRPGKSVDAVLGGGPRVVRRSSVDEARRIGTATDR